VQGKVPGECHFSLSITLPTKPTVKKVRRGPSELLPFMLKYVKGAQISVYRLPSAVASRLAS